MRYVSVMGGLWRLSERAYRKMLADMAKEKYVSLNAVGKFLGEVARHTDTTPEQAKEELKEIREQDRQRKKR